jgi:hypothetical protein
MPSRIRGHFNLKLDKNGKVLQIIGALQQGVSEHWEFVPEVQKVPNWKPSKQLTYSLLRRFYELKLL